jgi:predicted hotdog family 3-hydroxylacyl-ACP dehydratase
MMSSAEFPHITELVPHRGQVLLLDEVIEHDGESTLSHVDIASQNWLKREDGSVASWLALEYMAQCVSAHEGLCALAEGRSFPYGYLVKTTKLRIHRTRFEADESLFVRARRVCGRPGLGVLSHMCTVHASRMTDAIPPLAEGRLTLSLPGPSPIGVAQGRASAHG